MNGNMKKLAVIIATVLAAAALCGCVSGAQISNYNAGVSAYEAHDFETAKAHFERAGGYGNSKSYLAAIEEYERIYSEAVGYLEAHDYDSARHSFEAIREFGNSGDYLDFIQRLETRYNEGVEAFEAQDFLLANERFTQAQGYADSGRYLATLKAYEDAYRAALGFYYEGNYVRALEAFEGIGVPYRDSKERIESIYAYVTQNGMIPGIYRELFNAGCEAAGDDVSIPLTETTEGGFAWRTTNGLIIMGDTDGRGRITSMSFLMERALMNELGEDGCLSLYAHCIDALYKDGEGYDAILADIFSYLEGAKVYGRYSLLLEETDSGDEMLTATLIEADG